jgi:hypothetical protein
MGSASSSPNTFSPPVSTSWTCLRHDTAGMANLDSLAEASEGALTVIYDPFATTNLVVAVDGVSAEVIGPQRYDVLRPAVLGHDITWCVMLVGPVIGAGAVAPW